MCEAAPSSWVVLIAFLLYIVAVIATQYCHYGDDLDNLATLETADVQVVHV